MKGYIERRGPNSFRLVISDGSDGGGVRQKQTRLFKTHDGMTEAAKLKAADEALCLFLADLKRGFVAQSQGMTLEALWAYWQENYMDVDGKLEETTREYYRRLWPRIEKALGKLRIDRIEPKHLQTFYKNLSEPGIKQVTRKKKAPAGEETEQKPNTLKLSPVTVRKYHAMLSAMFEKAVKWKLMNYNPCDHVEAPQGSSKEKSIYDEETTGAMLEKLDQEALRHRLMVLLAIEGGLRREEIFGLCWRDVDFDTNEVNIRQVRVVVGTKVFTKVPKTKSSRRPISLPASLMELLKSHKAKEAEKRLKKGTAWQGKENTRDDLILTTYDGSDLHPQSMNNFLRRFCKEHSLPPIGPHTFRHMAGSFLLVNGTDLKTVSAKLGHSRTSVTADVYAHLLKRAETATADKMTNILDECRRQAKESAEKKKAQEK